MRDSLVSSHHCGSPPLPTTSIGPLPSSAAATAAAIASSSSSDHQQTLSSGRTTSRQGHGQTMNRPKSSTTNGTKPRTKPPTSNRFLHSGERLRENQDSKELEAHSSKEAPFVSNWQNWPRRHMHRSMSVDDMLEYQKQFSSPTYHPSSGSINVNEPAASFALDLAEHRQEFQPLFAEHTPLPPPVEDADTIRSKGNWGASAATAAAGSTPKKLVRKSIANSDLQEFKRQQSQKELEGKAKPMAVLQDSSSSSSSSNNNNNEEASPEEGTETTTANSTAGTISVDYQWGTQSLPKSILGSDLTTFQRSVKTAVLVNSRENSCDNFDDGSTSDHSSEKDSQRREDIHKKAMQQPQQQQQQQQQALLSTLSLDEANWGTRSLRRAIQQLETFEDDSYNNYEVNNKNDIHSRRCETVFENDIPEEKDFVSPMRSPWHDDDNIKIPKQPKMPSRVTSGEIQAEKLQQLFIKSALKTTRGKVSTQPCVEGLKMPRRVTSREDLTPKPVSESPDYDLGQKQPKRVVSDGNVNNKSPPPLEPEFRRSPFRRSISSSDIEKYQRHATDNNSDGSPSSDQQRVWDEAMHNQAEHAGTHSPHSSSGAAASQNAMGNAHPFSLQGVDLASLLLDEVDLGPPTTTVIKKKKHRHQRSRSDVPELHMEENITDIAPRKPRRTNSVDEYPEPSERFVRFAVDRTTVVEIPKVSEEMKPFLFYTKRDVKRFRMNEHRRQELQIREYMEYLNQKQGALEFGTFNC